MHGERGPGRAALAVLVLAASLVLVAPTTAVAADPPVPVPTFTVPPAGIYGHALWDSWFEPGLFGYEEQELFVSGTAVDEAGTPAPYTTRVIVTRPKDPATFNGTVLLDWVNVTAQFENPVDTILTRPMLLREGYAYVHVSVQAAGLCCLPQMTPKVWDPVRYAAISHPGDDWAFDMFTQVAQAFRTPGGAGSLDPMGSIGVGRVGHVLAAGQSQSAIRLHEYLEGWLPSHPSSVGVIDGVLVHGDIGEAKRYAKPVAIPMINLLSDAEAVDDGVDPVDLDPNVRLWEVAGTAHVDLWTASIQAAGVGRRHLAGAPQAGRPEYNGITRDAGNYGEQPTATLATCIIGGTATPMRYVTSTAIHQLQRWVDGGPAPRSGPRYQFSGGALAKDADGNTLGGIRLPTMDVPVASYLSTFCALGGITVPFTDQQLLQRYGSHAGYYQQMAEKTDDAVAAGWLLPEDAIDLMHRACAAKNRFGEALGPCPTYTPPAFDSLGDAGPQTTSVTTTPPSSVAGGGRTIPATGASVPVAAASVALLLGLGLAGLRRRAA